MINNIRRNTAHPVLILDAGNTLFGQMLALQSEGRVIVEAMNAMGYDAMTVGLADLSKGVKVLLARAEEARFAILSSNMVDEVTGELLLEPYTIIERDGMRFGILGVSEPDIVRAPSRDARTIKALDPVETVRRYLPEVEAASDVVILLSHLGLDEDKALAQAVPGIDIIVGGRTRKLMSTPERIGDTVIIQMGYDGEWLGQTEVVLNAEGVVQEAMVKVVTLGPDVPDDPLLARLVDTYERRYPTPTLPVKRGP